MDLRAQRSLVADGWLRETDFRAAGQRPKPCVVQGQLCSVNVYPTPLVNCRLRITPVRGKILTQ